MSDLKSRLEALPPEKRELLALKLKQMKTEVTEPLTYQIARIKRDQEFYPMSSAQKRLWFLQHLHPETPLYNEPLMVLQLHGSLDIPALEQAINELIRRHEVLRTTFHEIDGVPMQKVHPNQYVELLVRDELDVEAAEQEEATRLFDLEHGPLFRATLVRVEQQIHRLWLGRHHIVSDGWSASILLREICELYNFYHEKKPVTLPELSVQYVDYATWQQEWLYQNVAKEQVDYWSRKLRMPLPTIDLPVRKLTTENRTSHGARVSFHVPTELLEALLQLGRQQESTLYMTLLSAFFVLLKRYTGQEDLIVASPVANRFQEDVRGMIGCLVNTIALRADLTPQLSFFDLLQQVRQTMQEALENQELPFERVVEAVNPKRKSGQNSLTQLLFVLQDRPVIPNFSGLEEVQIDLVHHRMARFDLTMSLVLSQSGLQGSLEYNADLFDRLSMERMTNHFQMLLAGIVEHPELPISTLPLLTDEERNQVLSEWQGTDLAFPVYCLQKGFEAQAERTPDQIAVVYEGQSLTYRQLNLRSNRLARYLMRQGIGPGKLVGILLERSVEMVIGVLAVLKAGGGYVPLDINFPEDRVRYVLEDTNLSFVLTKQWLAQRVEGLVEHVLLLDTVDALCASESPANLSTTSAPHHVAYVIFTSGSTGRPKGVVVAHAEVLNYVQGIVSRMGIANGWSFAGLQSLAVDSTKTVLFGSLLTGGCLHMISEERAVDSVKLSAYFHEHRIDVLKIAPSHLAALMSNGEPERVLPEQLLILGGEASRWEWIESWLEKAKCVVYNHYGPTEATVGMLTYPIAEGRKGSTVPLGRPLPNTEVYLLDEHMQPVPVGVPGELYIGGRCLARGYLNQPVLTEERFVPHVFQKESGNRLYRTGDLMRFLPDGNLEYLGRIDNQVKIRGFRVEMGEIEVVLGQHPAVAEVAVTVFEKKVGDQLLVAYVVLNTEVNIRVEDLLNSLRNKLPSYMVPACVQLLDHLPRMLHGKLDRKALPVPTLEPVEKEIVSFASFTPLQEIIAGIWSEVLHVQSIGLQDNFFALGGHSLLGTKMIAKIAKQLKVHVPLQALFEEPSLEGLASRIEKTILDEAGVVLPPILPATDEEPIPLSFAQERLWFIEQMNPRKSQYNMHFGVRIRGPLQEQAMLTSVHALVERHSSLRTYFLTKEGELVQCQWSIATLTSPVHVIDLRTMEEAKREEELVRLAKAEVNRPFLLGSDLLFRVTCYRLNADEHVLIFVMHHMVSDGWSNRLLLQELMELYDSYSSETSASLQPLLIQYADYAVWQRRMWSEKMKQTQLQYWSDKLHGAPPILELPTDHPRPLVSTYRGGHFQHVLSEQLTANLRLLSRKCGVTVYMVLLAAFQTLLYRYSGQTDIVLGTTIANRNREETENVVGLFANTLVLRTDLTAQPTFVELLERVRNVTLEAYANQDTPFEQIVEALKPERSINYHPIFQVMFNFQDSLSQVAHDHLEIHPLYFETGVAKFDLTLNVIDHGSELHSSFEFSLDLFEQKTMERLAYHWQTLLEAVVSNPEKTVSTLSLITANECQVMFEWNQTKTDFPNDMCIHELFEQQAARTPNAVAIVYGEQILTYGELDRRANQVAHLLQHRGVHPETVVGIAMERSPEMIVTMLGILKTGGVYVPLDPLYPQERIEFMLADSQANVLVTQQHMLRSVGDFVGQVVCLDTNWSAVAEESSEKPVVHVTAEHLAYVIYTSGSTGKPKGVCVPHRAVNRLVCNTNYVQIEGNDRVAQVSNTSFDAATFEIWGALLKGACVVGFETDVILSPQRFAKAIQEQAISTLFLTTALLNQIVDFVPDAFSTIKNLLFGGERCDPRTVRNLLHHGAPQRLLHVYGPTESTTFATWYLIKQVSEADTTIPIGYPLANTELYVLDENLQFVPVGVPGELYIGGDGLAHGYLNRSDLTSQKFIAHPFGQTGAKLFKTGDLVRRRIDGAIEYLRRTDDQIKLRGFRVELGEIQSELQHIDAVEKAVVVYRQEEIDSRLVAYVVSKREITPDEIRQFLKMRLPDFMVPAEYVFLNEMPLTPNGKVDLRNLPAPSEAVSRSAKLVAPRTPLEQIVAEKWAESFGVTSENISVHDNFFEHGGHSLLAVKLMATLQELLQIELPVQMLFTQPTIAALSQMILEKDETLAELMAEFQEMSDEEINYLLVNETR